MAKRDRQVFLNAVKCLAFVLTLIMVLMTQLSQVHAAEFDISDGTLVKYNGSGSTATVPSGVTCIGEQAFADKMDLVTVQLPDTVKEIKQGAFFWCTNLSTVQNLSNATSLGTGIFESCKKLQNIEFNSNLKEIPDYTFYSAVILDDFYCPSSVERIGNYAFRNCKVDHVILPAGLKSMGYEAFCSCWITDLTIPSSVETIENRCFLANPNLTEITYEGTSAQWNDISIGSENDTLTSVVIHCSDKDLNTGGGSSTCVLKFNANGGSCKIKSKSMSAGSQCGAMPTATKSGYYFNGWYTKKSGGTQITESTVISNSMTLYAHWTKRKSLAKAKVSVGSPTYDGTAKTPAVTVKLNKTTLKNGTDYKVTYSNNIKASSKAVAKITGINKYKGSVKKLFTIKKHGMDKNSVTANVAKSSYEYTGKAIKPGITVYFNGKKMKKGTDYKVSYRSNKEPGKAYVQVTGMGNFTSTARLFGFTITKAKQPMTLSKGSFSMRWKNIGESVSFKVSGVKESAKVTVSSSDPDVAAVKKTLTSYKITIKGVGQSTISVKTKETKHYKATEKTISVEVADRADAELTASSDHFDLDISDAPFNLGVTRKGTGAITYSISKEDQDKNVATVDSDGNVTLTGNEGSISIVIKSAATSDYKEGSKVITITVTDKDKLYWPVRKADLTPIVEIKSHPGDIVAGMSHRGIDIGGAEGAGWYSATDGTIVYVFRGCITDGENSHANCSPNHPDMQLSKNSHGVVCNNGFGNGCVIKSVINGKTYYLQYAHMDSVSDSLVEGAQISAGTYLGQVGNKGFSFGTHAHFEIDEETSVGSYWGRPTNNDPGSPECEFLYRY